MNEMQELMQKPDVMNEWFKNKKKEFDALPEDQKQRIKKRTILKSSNKIISNKVLLRKQKALLESKAFCSAEHDVIHSGKEEDIAAGK